MLSFKITGVYQKYMIFHLISYWINWIVKSPKLKLLYRIAKFKILTYWVNWKEYYTY